MVAGEYHTCPCWGSLYISMTISVVQTIPQFHCFSFLSSRGLGSSFSYSMICHQIWNLYNLLSICLSFLIRLTKFMSMEKFSVVRKIFQSHWIVCKLFNVGISLHKELHEVFAFKGYFTTKIFCCWTKFNPSGNVLNVPLFHLMVLSSAPVPCYWPVLHVFPLFSLLAT